MFEQQTPTLRPDVEGQVWDKGEPRPVRPQQSENLPVSRSLRVVMSLRKIYIIDTCHLRFRWRMIADRVIESRGYISLLDARRLQLVTYMLPPFLLDGRDCCLLLRRPSDLFGPMGVSCARHVPYSHRNNYSAVNNEPIRDGRVLLRSAYWNTLIIMEM